MIALRDGYIDMPKSRLRQEDNRPCEKLPDQVEVVDGQLRLSVNAFLIIDGEDLTLIDTGAGNSLGATMGELLSALEEAGIARDKISTVALTHTHGDHAPGLVSAEGLAAFPNLVRLFVPRAELPLFDGIARVAHALCVFRLIAGDATMSTRCNGRADKGVFLVSDFGQRNGGRALIPLVSIVAFHLHGLLTWR
ncbi:MBL fold metallo-hydrolase [Phyllobacterium sp. K27]